ncbi:preprotein translocase subunit SecE [Gallaecimonas sp. GXIMD4217]|uniref:preprotein translocase subunit SecE n=1 Tax=Gallaecimonas sp. GXIMD4217 TaxID=3131927 RepID=UPI00311AF010
MNANAEQQQQSNGALDTLLWVVVVAILAGIVVANYFFGEEVHLAVRAGVAVVAFGLAFGLAAMTSKGKEAIGFAKESRTEVRKVVWPTRQETTHTTLIIMAATAVVGLLLWILDGALLRLVGWITGLEI